MVMLYFTMMKNKGESFNVVDHSGNLRDIIKILFFHYRELCNMRNVRYCTSLPKVKEFSSIIPNRSSQETANNSN